MISVEDFFIAPGDVNYISEEEYKSADRWIEAFEALSRITYQSIYIIDYYKQEFLYISENPLFLSGYAPEEVKKMGYLFYMKQVPADELELLFEINQAGFEFYHRTAIEDRLKYTISYDFHLERERNKILINHKLTPLALNKEGKIWLAACVVSLSGNSSPGNIEMHKMGENSFWTYSREGKRWKQKEAISLNEREKNILSLSAQGYTMNEIADQLCLSVDTVKFHKRKLFEKLAVKNITEALSLAINYRLL